MNIDIDNLIIKIQDSLNDSLLTSKYKKLNRVSKFEGHCYAASEALYHFLGGKENGYTPVVASWIENDKKYTHWWIKDKNNNIIDVTANQFYEKNQKPPYESGKNCGFLTKLPSKRAKIIIEYVLNNSDNIVIKKYKL